MATVGLTLTQAPTYARLMPDIDARLVGFMVDVLALSVVLLPGTARLHTSVFQEVEPLVPVSFTCEVQFADMVYVGMVVLDVL